MANIRLTEMTRALCRAFFSEFTHDPDLFTENQPFTEYVYAQEKADAYWQRHRDLRRVHLAVMLQDEPIGEIILKNIDRNAKVCTMGITVKNDTFKNKGYGTQAEKMALEFAFSDLGMKTVRADALLKNERSKHVLKKAGFVETHRDSSFCYFQCQKPDLTSVKGSAPNP